MKSVGFIAYSPSRGSCLGHIVEERYARAQATRMSVGTKDRRGRITPGPFPDAIVKEVFVSDD